MTQTQILMERIMRAAQAIYPSYKVEVYDEPHSQRDEFITFTSNSYTTGQPVYRGKIHWYQLWDVMKADLNADNYDEHLKVALRQQ